MKYISWGEIEAEIELQRLEREQIESPKKTRKKTIKKTPKKKTLPPPVVKRKYVPKRLLNDVQEEILKTLREMGDMTRKALVLKIEIPRTTLFDNLNKLARKNLIKKSPHPKGKRGRPTISWSADMG